MSELMNKIKNGERIKSEICKDEFYTHCCEEKSNCQLPKESILEEVRKNAYNSTTVHENSLAIDNDMKYIANRVDKWQDFIKEVADIFARNSPFGMISTHIYCFNKDYNSDQNDLINAVFCFLADNYGNCSEDKYNRLRRNPELALQNSKEWNSNYEFISVKDYMHDGNYARKFDIGIKKYNLLTKSLITASPIGTYYIDEKRVEIVYSLSKSNVDVFEVNRILTALINLRKE